MSQVDLGETEIRVVKISERINQLHDRIEWFDRVDCVVRWSGLVGMMI